MQVFYGLASLNHAHETSKRFASPGGRSTSAYQMSSYIDKHQFVEGISIIAITVYNSEPNKITRVHDKFIYK
jgi:hypothetical protein